jgi:hypothetical protein
MYRDKKEILIDDDISEAGNTLSGSPYLTLKGSRVRKGDAMFLASILAHELQHFRQYKKGQTDATIGRLKMEAGGYRRALEILKKFLVKAKKAGLNDEQTRILKDQIRWTEERLKENRG